MPSRLLRFVFVSLFLHFATTASAEDARALLERAIHAHGGADRLEHTKKGHLKGNSEDYRNNAAFKGQIEEWFDLPDRYKYTVDGSSNGIPIHNEEGYTGKEHWIRQGSNPLHVSPVHQPIPLLYNWFAIMPLLLSLRDKEVQLKSLPDETKDGQAFAGFRATSQQRSTDLFFDKSTGLLERTRRTTSNHLSGEESIEETIYEDYHNIEGVRYPMRFKVFTGKIHSFTATLTSVEFGNVIDERVFATPQLSALGRPIERDEQSPVSRDWLLIVATLGGGVAIGAAWLIVRVTKRGKRETPTS